VSSVVFLLVLLLTVFLAALGRSAIPHNERLPWRTWTLRDLAANVVHGARVLAELDQGQRPQWCTQPHDRAPGQQRSGGG
jgi:hypothetical protein